MAPHQPVGLVLRAAYVVAMRVLQSDLYQKLDEEEKSAVQMCIEDYNNPSKETQ